MRKSRAQDTPSPDPGASGPAGSPPQAEARFPRPKILVIDAPDVTPALQQRGYAAISGSFGQPTRVAKGPGYLPVDLAGFLPGYTEQEIVVVDLAGPEPQQSAVEPVEPPGPGVPSIWAPTASGLVDPRPAVMWRAK